MTANFPVIVPLKKAEPIIIFGLFEVSYHSKFELAFSFGSVQEPVVAPISEGDMLKSVYDTNNNNIVDQAETTNNPNASVDGGYF